MPPSMARPLFEVAKGYVAVVYGDHPLLRAVNFRLVTDRLDAGMDVAILGFEPADPTGYGRFITDGERLLAIREHKDASEEERKIGLCNACILAFRAEVFRALIDKVDSQQCAGRVLRDRPRRAGQCGRVQGRLCGRAGSGCDGRQRPLAAGARPRRSSRSCGATTS